MGETQERSVSDEPVVYLTEEQVRLMTNSRKAQSEKLATGGGRETTAVKPDNKLGLDALL